MLPSSNDARSSALLVARRLQPANCIAATGNVVREKAPSRRGFASTKAGNEDDDVRKKALSRRSFAGTNATNGGILQGSTGNTKSELAANEDDVVREKAPSRRSFASKKAPNEDDVVREKAPSRRLPVRKLHTEECRERAPGLIRASRLQTKMML
jgi:hypothetical protein